MGMSIRRTAPLLAAFCLFPAVFAPQAKAQATANADICAADDDSAYSAEQRVAACGVLIKAAKDAPKQLSAALVNRGAAYWYMDKMPQAFADLDRAIALDPTNARAYLERSNSHRSAGHLDRALADANEAVRLDPSNAKALDNRGNVFNNKAQYDRAIEDYNEALRLDPKFSLGFKDRGAAYYFKHDYNGAIRDYDEAIRLNPKNDEAYTNRAAAYTKLGRHEQAIADDSAAIKLDSTQPVYFDNRGLSYAASGDDDRAIADFDEAIRLSPTAGSLTHRGDAYQHKGDHDRAIVDYDRALKLDPAYSRAYNNRGAAFRDKEDLDHAIADYERALKLDPRFSDAADNLKEVRVLRDRRDKTAQSALPTFDCHAARRAVEKAICSDPDLSRLDRQIDDAYKAALARADRKGANRLRKEQHDFIARRDRKFGDPAYEFKHELEARLGALDAGN